MKRKSLIFLITLALIGCGTSNNGEIKVEDPYLWLEEVEGKKALEWVESQNKLTEERYSNNPRFNQTYSYLLEDYISVDRIPYPSIWGEYIYNFWRDKNNIRGLWRRASIDSYKSENPKWEILDIDLLAKAENKNWAWRGSDCLAPDFTKCLISSQMVARMHQLSENLISLQKALLKVDSSHLKQNKTLLGLMKINC